MRTNIHPNTLIRLALSVEPVFDDYSSNFYIKIAPKNHPCSNSVKHDLGYICKKIDGWIMHLAKCIICPMFWKINYSAMVNFVNILKNILKDETPTKKKFYLNNSIQFYLLSIPKQCCKEHSTLIFFSLIPIVALFQFHMVPFVNRLIGFWFQMVFRGTRPHLQSILWHFVLFLFVAVLWRYSRFVFHLLLFQFFFTLPFCCLLCG